MIQLSIRCILLIGLAALAGCSSVEPVASWQRGYLAKPAMQWDNSPQEARIKGHIYSSKEASSGGNGAAGGGCGCN